MNQTSSNNKRIASNTALLYIRMLLIMGVSLYTSRVILDTLGIEDFGIYNVVAGIVVMFTFINSALSSATQRFLNYELGQANLDAVRSVFNASLVIHLCIAMCIVLAAETIGLWFIRHKLNIPLGKESLVFFVYQLSILTTCINLMTIPFHAKIIAYERMGYFAYLGGLEALLKLVIAFALTQVADNRLQLYAFLMMLVPFIVLISHFIYCRRQFTTSRLRLVRDKKLYGHLVSFSGWSLFGGIATMGASQGLSVLLNLYYGVMINAAVGVANQVQSAVTSFSTNFQTAFRPQIVKSYATQNLDYLRSLMLNTSKFSFLLLFTIAFPVMLNIDYILALWLRQIPDLTSSFIILILMYSLLESFCAPLWMLVQATGRIRNYQIMVSLLFISNVFFSYVALRMGAMAEVVFLIKLGISVVIQAFRIYYVDRILPGGATMMLKKSIIPTLLLSLGVAALVIVLTLPFNGIVKLICSGMLFIPLYAAVIYRFLLDGTQRKQLIQAIRQKIN